MSLKSWAGSGVGSAQRTAAGVALRVTLEVLQDPIDFLASVLHRDGAGPAPHASPARVMVFASQALNIDLCVELFLQEKWAFDFCWFQMVPSCDTEPELL